jgi:hypothetical protein
VVVVAGSPPLSQVVSAMLDVLHDFLPAAPPPLPAAGVSLVSVVERSVGIGNYRGDDVIGSFGIRELKGVRLDALVRYQLWAGGPVDADQAALDLNTALLAARDTLRAAGVLRLSLEAAQLAELQGSINAWRKVADYRVLYEFPYVDTGGAESLIARIPIDAALDDPSLASEVTIVTDEMTRWSNEPTADPAAPPLTARGPFSIATLASLSFLTTPPTGTVTITRTFDGAQGGPVPFLDLPTFIDAVSGDEPAERHARVVLASIGAFLADLGAPGPPVELGDWDANTNIDAYELRTLAIEPPIELPGLRDRFEIAYEQGALEEVGVVYLRASRGGSA